ncbi:SusC/RagA family TonB-linked outer membrane protein [Maribellus sediminis]|uniref:SusC/RagA family TonB-linked outer membrane protein n=1 Tax=Maribellus sediminis TaxID=2696285 RepID=UPI001431647D|nr:TonB-dependent receptor [Maribellus sediminis]
MLLVTVCISLIGLQAHSQQSTSLLQGKVLDEKNQSLPGVTVVVKGTTNGTVTDIDGNFSLNVTVGDILSFSFIGYQTQEISITDYSEIEIKMVTSTQGLDEVVVVGYGTQSRRTVTSAITKVDGDVLKNIPINTVGDGLKGKIAGARLYTNNYQPGEDPTIRIRGGSSINKSNDPLILVDGIERAFSGINPNDIESVEVLKDAASTAIYGSRASNGVVLITTKKGTKSKAPRITFEATTALQEAETLIDFMNAEDYINTVRPAVALGPKPQLNFQSGYSASSGNDASSIYTTRYLNDGEAVPEGYKSMPDPLDPSKTLVFQDNSFQDQIYKQALWQNYYVGIDGGNDAIRYAASVGYTDDEGVALATGYSRFSTRANTDIKISEKLDLTAGFDYSTTLSEEYDKQQNVISRGLACPPTQRIYNDDGTPTPGYNATSPNPVWYAYTRDISNKDNRLAVFGELNYQILPSLKANVQLSTYNHVSQYDYFEKAHQFNGLRPTKSSFGELSRNKLDTYFSYVKSFNDVHALSAMAGYSYTIRNSKSLSAAVSGASSDKVPTLSAGPTKTAADSGFEKEVLIGYFGRFSYDYLKKYLVTLTFREDASSRFAEGHQWGFFPGASIGWVASEESFMKNVSKINNLKIRGSYGQTGNNSIGLYDALGIYSTSTKYYGTAGIRATTMPNQDLTWETSTQLDLGLDLTILDNRISFSGDYFNKITDNLLFSKSLPNTSGFSSVQTNIGKVRFRGFDLELTTQNIQGKNFQWESKLTWSYVKNKVLELPENGRDKNRIGGITLADGSAFGGIAEGEPLYRYYGYVVEGILETEAAAAAARYDDSAKGWSTVDQKSIKGRKSVGDYEWMDRDGDGKITSKDQYELGVTVPHTTGGLNNNFTYKNFSLNIFMDWALGHYINDNSFMRYFMNTFAYNYTLVDEVKECWTQPGDDTKYARFTANDPDDGNKNFSRTSNIFNYKGDYLCIREVSLQYNIKPDFISKWGIYGIALTLSGNNLYYFTATKGINPEVGSSTTYNASYYNYPPIRRYAIGAKITF